MSDIITLTGVVATIPRSLTTREGLAITSFRLASSQRRFDRGLDKWVDGDTNWYTITTFRQLAANAAVSIKKGERVVVSGRLRIRDWATDEKAGTSVDIEADAVGHDLTWGTASFSRNAAGPHVDSAQVESQHLDSPTAPGSAVHLGDAGPAEFPSAAAQDAAAAQEGDATLAFAGANGIVETPF